MVEYLVSKIYNQIDNLIRYNIAKSKHNAEKKHKRGFTLIEIVVVLAITVLIAGVIYTFYNSNNRTLTGAEAKSILQTEANQIQKEIINIGTQATSIKVNKSAGEENGELKVEKFTFSVYNNDDPSDRGCTDYVFDATYGSNELTKSDPLSKMKIYKSDKNSDDVKEKSGHIKSVTMKALDSGDITEAGINNSSNVQITVNLYIKKGYSEYNYPITTIVKLRNKDAK